MTPTTPTAAPGVSAEVEASDVAFKAMKHAHAFCPTDMPHLDRMRWMAKHMETALLANAAGGEVAQYQVRDVADTFWCNVNEHIYNETARLEGAHMVRKLYAAPPPPVGEPQGVSELYDEEIFAFADSIDAQCTVLDPQACKSMGLPIGTRSDGNLTNEKMLAITRHFAASRLVDSTTKAGGAS